MPRDLRRVVPLGAIIAERELLFSCPDDEPRTIRVRIGAPVPDPATSTSFLCPIVISGFEKEEKLVLGGVDTMQALGFGLQSLGPFLSLCAKQYGGTLTWLDGQDLGFPEPTKPIGTRP